MLVVLLQIKCSRRGKKWLSFDSTLAFSKMIVLIFCAVFAGMYLWYKLSIARCRCKVCLVGKTALVTGANSGIGYEVALDLASRGCKVIIADVVDGTESRNKIIQETGNINIAYKKLDLQSLKSVRKFAEDILATETQLNILICNAGIASINLDYTEDGLQKTMQVNYFSHFLLVHLLTDLLAKSAPSRVIFTSSLAAYTARFELDELNPAATYSKSLLTAGVYGNSKLCLAVATVEFSERFRGKGITVNCFHPGGTRTNIFYKAFLEERSYGAAFLGLLTLPFGRSAADGAQTAIHLACSNKLKNVTGCFFMECKKVNMPSAVSNKELCEKIWKNTEDYVKLSPNEKL